MSEEEKIICPECEGVGKERIDATTSNCAAFLYGIDDCKLCNGAGNIDVGIKRLRDRFKLEYYKSWGIPYEK